MDAYIKIFRLQSLTNLPHICQEEQFLFIYKTGTLKSWQKIKENQVSGQEIQFWANCSTVQISNLFYDLHLLIQEYLRDPLH